MDDRDWDDDSCPMARAHKDYSLEDPSAPSYAPGRHAMRAQTSDAPL